MRRRLSVLVAFAIVLAACSSGGDSASSTAPTSAGGAEPSTEGAVDGNERPVFDYSMVDYDAEPVGSALRGDRLDPAFPPPVINPDDIRSGGPPPDGIPSIDGPQFVPVDEVDFISDDNEAVVVLEINGDARAYPVQILIWHEIVNDIVGGVPVSISYCPLCNSALAFERTLGDRVLDFGTSGELYQSALVMYDRQTESLWAHFTGEGIVGHYAGAQLTLVPAQTLGFSSFAEAFPNGTVLARPTGVARPYGSNPYVGYDNPDTNPRGAFIALDLDEQFAAKARVLGVIDGDQAFSILLEDLAAVGAVPITEAGRNLVAFHTGGLASSLEAEGIADGRDVGQTGVFVAETAAGSPLTFLSDGAEFVDNETGSRWNIRGAAVAGSLAGEQLAAVPLIDTFWFSWATYQPDQILITP